MPGAGDFRPMPEGFAENAWLSLRELTVLYKAGQNAIQRWRRELGGEDPRLSMRIPPEDFAERAKTTSKIGLRRHYNVGEDRINSWLKALENPPTPPSARVRRPVPDDFAEVAETTTQTGLMRHYVADWTTVKRWIATSGARPLAYVPSPPPRRANFTFQGHAQTLRHADLRTVSMYDIAADDLRRERFVVYRCDHRGRADQKGDFWRIGNTLLTPDELLQRAEKYRSKAA